MTDDFGIKIPLTDDQCMKAAWNGFAHIIVDKDGNIEAINHSAETMFGYPSGELLGQPIEKLVSPGFRDEHAGFRELFYADPSVRPINAGLPVEGVRRDGSPISVIVGLSQFWPNRKPYTAVVILGIAGRKTPLRAPVAS